MKASDDLDFDHDLTFAGPGLRLRGRARWAALLIALATLLPYELVMGDPQFLWNLAGELDLAGLLAYLAPALAGLTIAAASVLTRRDTSLAVATLVSLATAALVVHLGEDTGAWRLLPQLPDSVATAPGVVVLVLGMTAAGANLSFAPRDRRIGRALLIAAAIIAMGFFVWPNRGETPLDAVVRIVVAIQATSGWRYQIGYGVIALLALWPLLVALLGLFLLRWPPKDQNPTIGLVAHFGLPLMLTMLLVRTLPGAAEGWNMFMVGGAIATLVGFTALVASGLEVALPALFATPSTAPNAAHNAASNAARGLSPRRAALVGIGGLLCCGVIQAALAWPPSKGVEWTLHAPTAEADALFEHAVTRWNNARLRWDEQARNASGAAAHLKVKQAALAMKRAAQKVDPGVAEALDGLSRSAHDLNAAGRVWYREIAKVNDAIRAASLPYYLDPTVITLSTEGGVRRHFRMRSYRIAKVERYDVDGRDFATLHVTRLSSDRRELPLLGFSRDRQPFAIVQLEEIATFAEALVGFASGALPTCDHLISLRSAGAQARCGAVLKPYTLDEAKLTEALVALTARHELQHQIDGPQLNMSSAVLTTCRRRSPAYKERVNRELSGYLAELTATDAPPKLGLVHLFRFAVSERPGTLRDVAVIALEALSGEQLQTGDTVHLTAVVEAIDALAALDDDALRERTADAWAALFGARLPTVKTQNVSENPNSG